MYRVGSDSVVASPSIALRSVIADYQMTLTSIYECDQAFRFCTVPIWH